LSAQCIQFDAICKENLVFVTLEQYEESPVYDNSNRDPPKTISVPEAGRRYFDLSRGASYAAAANGQIPTIRIGRLLRVPIAAMERVLDSAGEITRK
jgi:hypothetical protein